MERSKLIDEKDSIKYKTFGKKKEERKISINHLLANAGIAFGIAASSQRNSVLMKTFIDETLAIDYAIFNNFRFPFENLVLEGGGMKGIGYLGAFQVLEEANILPQIKRVCGVSIGSVMATLFICGYSTSEMEGMLLEDIDHITIDHSCGYCSIIPNLCKNYGWNPGNRMKKWIGEKIKEKFGKANLTFRELFEENGKELCIVITNLSQMNTEYFHVKTTPNCPIAKAVRMSTSIPGLYQAPVHKQSDGSNDIYVDGGVLCNYPIHAFDGWWLSLKKEDSFFRKLYSLDECTRLNMNKERFSSRNEATLGLVLYAQDEVEIMKSKFEHRKGFRLPKMPNTKFARSSRKAKRHEESVAEEDAEIRESLDKFLITLRKVDVTTIGTILVDEFKRNLEKSSLTTRDYKILFGETDLEKVIKKINRDNDKEISYEELTAFIRKSGVDFFGKFLGYNKRKIESFIDFISAIESALAISLMKSNFQEEDIHRTIGINTGYVGTTDFDIEEEDLKYVVECGANAARAYLREYCHNHPEQYRYKGGVLPEAFFVNRGRNKQTESFQKVVTSLIEARKSENLNQCQINRKNLSDAAVGVTKDVDCPDNTESKCQSEDQSNGMLELENDFIQKLLKMRTADHELEDDVF